MARSGRYRVKFRRRREGKTEYRKRLALLKSGLPRMVVRKTNRYIIVQFVETKLDGDRVLAYAFSKELTKYGWPYSGKCLPAAYLTGLLAGYRALRAGVRRAVLDIGRHPSTRGSRIYASLKGALDAGVEVPHGEEILPDEDRIRGVHIASWARELREKDQDRYEKIFSGYIRAGADPEDMPEMFSKVLERIRGEFISGGEDGEAGWA